MKKILLSLIALGGLAALLMAQKTPSTDSTTESDLPDVVVNGYKAYKSGGYMLASTTWTRDSALAVDPLILPAFRNNLALNTSNGGQFLGADAIATVKLSATTKEIYTVARFERLVIYMNFTCYKVGDKWIVTAIDDNRDPIRILPTAIMSGQQPIT